MVRNPGLLGRIDRLEAGDLTPRRGSHAEPRKSDVIESVITHLNKLFNTRQGNSSCCPDYGLPDFNSLAMEFPDMVRELGDAILRQITVYEPRLRNPSVKHLQNPDDPTNLVFSISGDIAENNSSHARTSFRVNLSQGMVKIR